jgi:uncharacterized protein
MYIGIMKIELRFPTVESIKDKRRIVNRVKDRIAARFKVSIAEIENQDSYGSSILGICYVSNKSTHATEKGQNIFTFLENNESDIFHDYNLIVEEY